MSRATLDEIIVEIDLLREHESKPLNTRTQLMAFGARTALEWVLGEQMIATKVGRQVARVRKRLGKDGTDVPNDMNPTRSLNLLYFVALGDKKERYIAKRVPKIRISKGRR